MVFRWCCAMQPGICSDLTYFVSRRDTPAGNTGGHCAAAQGSYKTKGRPSTLNWLHKCSSILIMWSCSNSRPNKPYTPEQKSFTLLLLTSPFKTSFWRQLIVLISESEFHNPSQYIRSLSEWGSFDCQFSEYITHGCNEAAGKFMQRKVHSQDAVQHEHRPHTVATLIYPAGKNLKHIWLSIVNFRCAGHVSASLTSNLNIDSRVEETQC